MTHREYIIRKKLNIVELGQTLNTVSLAIYFSRFVVKIP